MTKPRSKSEILSKTCLSYLESWIKEKIYGRGRDISSVDAIAKWIECENEAVFVLNQAIGKNYTKSVYKEWEKMENERCTGHEDIDGGDHTIDTKVCLSFDQFPLFEEEADKDYYRQGQAYMRLKWPQYKYHIIAKVLVNTPIWLIEQKLYYLYSNLCKKYRDNMDYVEEEYEEKARKIFLQNVFDKQVIIQANGVTLQLTDKEVIPYEKRVHLTVIERNEEDIAKIPEEVDKCRNYLSKLWY